MPYIHYRGIPADKYYIRVSMECTPPAEAPVCSCMHMAANLHLPQAVPNPKTKSHTAEIGALE